MQWMRRAATWHMAKAIHLQCALAAGERAAAASAAVLESPKLEDRLDLVCC
jgi:hypothetical protein